MRELQVSDEDFDMLGAGREVSGIWGRPCFDATAGEVVKVTRPRIHFTPEPTIIANPESMTARIVGVDAHPKGVLLKLRA